MASELEVREKKLQKKRDMIKNILIVFLVIMLLLTFFSGTIQNWSLPEVATSYVQSASISPQIRGTGTVEADDPYNVTATESRKIASVKVKAGDEVQKGDVIYELEDADSTEVETLKKELQDLIDAYNTALFAGTLTDATIEKARNGNFGSIDDYQSRLRDVNDRYNAAVAADAAIQAQIDKLNATQTVTDTTSQNQAITNANNTIANLESQIAAKETQQANASSVQTTLNAMVSALTTAETNAGTSASSDPTVQSARQTLKTYLESQGQTVASDASNAKSVANSYLITLQMQIAQLTADITSLNSQKSAQESIITAMNTEISQLTGVTEAQKTAQLNELNTKKAQTAAQVEALKAEQEATLSGIQGELSLSSQLRKISDAQEKVDELVSESVGSAITAPVDGTVTSVSYSAGQSFEKDATLAVIQVSGKAMTLSISVTNDQAKTLKVGDTADPQNSWYYSDFKCTLTAIRPDTTDPTNKKLLVFNVESSEVTAGQSVSIKIGQANVNYDMTVPNSAIREDNNGKFILIIETKSSPLRNRYIARRVDVDVVASDDTTTAITAALEGYEYVITTSNASISAGQEVRLAEGGY